MKKVFLISQILEYFKERSERANSAEKSCSTNIENCYADYLSYEGNIEKLLSNLQSLQLELWMSGLVCVGLFHYLFYFI